MSFVRDIFTEDSQNLTEAYFQQDIRRAVSTSFTPFADRLRTAIVEPTQEYMAPLPDEVLDRIVRLIECQRPWLVTAKPADVAQTLFDVFRVETADQPYWDEDRIWMHVSVNLMRYMRLLLATERMMERRSA